MQAITTTCIYTGKQKQQGFFFITKYAIYAEGNKQNQPEIKPDTI